MKYFKTSEIAKAAGVHPNTVRLYEDLGLLQPVKRRDNNYRLYTQAHMDQMRLARIALERGFVEGGIRKQAISIVRTAAKGNLELALEEAYNYITHINNEQRKADEALMILRKWINKRNEPSANHSLLGRANTSSLLGISIDVLRNWERNGLLHVPRNSKNGYRMYGQNEIDRAKIIRTLRMANYSMMAILRMLNVIDTDRRESDVISIARNPQPDEDLIYATDHWILTLREVKKDADEVIVQIKRMLNKENHVS